MANSCVWLTVYIFHRLDWGQECINTHIKYLYNRKSNSDHIMKQLLTLVLRHQCQIQYSRYSIVFLFQSFCKSCIELCLVCKWTCGKTKRAKNRVLTSSRSSLKIKFIHSFLTSGSEGRQCKDCFFPKTGHCTVRGVLVSQFMTPYSTEVLQVWNIWGV